VADVDRVLTEVFRVLKLNGRTVFVATDWDALVWFSDDPKRMSAVMKSWEAHCAHPRLPRSMAFRLVNAGFRLDGAAVFPILNLQCTDDTYSKALAQLIRNFVGNRKDVSPDDLMRGMPNWSDWASLGGTFSAVTDISSRHRKILLNPLTSASGQLHARLTSALP
jgi:hypothetical protein